MNAPGKRGLRVFHNSNTAQKVEVVVAAGAELTVDVSVAKQLTQASTHFEVDEKEFAAAKADADEEQAKVTAEAEERAHREYHRVAESPADAVETVPDAKPRTRKPRTPKSDA